jgi:hypothetical protein
VGKALVEVEQYAEAVEKFKQVNVDEYPPKYYDDFAKALSKTGKKKSDADLYRKAQNKADPR